jgi:hypothetical protein
MAKETTLNEIGEMLAHVVKHMATKDDLQELEHVHLEWNREGFPEGREYDSCCVLEAEASMHGTSLFA